jgi:hypothetical protein
MQTISLDQLTRVTGGACPQPQQPPQGGDAGQAPAPGGGGGGGWDQILGGIEQFLAGLRGLLGPLMQPSSGSSAPPDAQPQPDAQQS